jgi:hypothetical protein
VTVLTEAFRTASVIRAKTLGMPDHPTVVLEHPMASKTEAQVLSMAQRFVDQIVAALVRKP